jgi:glycosyltransferase involved in cell wall biosynthesis
MPSRDEGVPLAMLDAMAAGAVVVSTDVGDISEVITNGVNGVLVRSGSEAEVVKLFVEAVLAIERDREYTADLQRRARERVSQFTWDDVAAAVLGHA